MDREQGRNRFGWQSHGYNDYPSQGGAYRGVGVVSHASRVRARCFFRAAVVVSLVPFLGLIVYNGYCDPILGWLTGGEVVKLTPSQRRFILFEVCVWVVLFPAAVGALIVYYVAHHAQATTENSSG
jgi:hypothetical protein